jgi:MtN3 and saliva related transmembrane protein
MLITIIGILAAALTSLSYIPQVAKALPVASTNDLSSKTLAVLAAGLALWIGYGILKGDFVIIVANAVGPLFVAMLIGFKIRDAGQSPDGSPQSGRL